MFLCDRNGARFLFILRRRNAPASVFAKERHTHTHILSEGARGWMRVYGSIDYFVRFERISAVRCTSEARSGPVAGLCALKARAARRYAKSPARSRDSPRSAGSGSFVRVRKRTHLASGLYKSRGRLFGRFPTQSAERILLRADYTSTFARSRVIICTL